MENNYIMLLNHNTITTVTWNSKRTNSEIKEVKVQLDNNTQDWDRILNSILISYNELANIVDNIDWKSEKNTFFYCKIC